MIGLVFTLIIMTGSIYLIIEGNKKNDSAEFYGGLIATILSIFLMCLVIQNIKNTENMGKIYKFKRLNEMKLDDYGSVYSSTMAFFILRRQRVRDALM